MKFGEIRTRDAVGAILAHRTRAGQNLFHKGRCLTVADVDFLKGEGVDRVCVAKLDVDDVDENSAATKIAGAFKSTGIVRTGASTGRVNFHAVADGILTLQSEMVDLINSIDPSITLATLRPYQRVHRNQIVATLKIMPYAIHSAVADTAVNIATSQEIFSAHPFSGLSVGLIQCTSPSLKDSVLNKTRSTLEARVVTSRGTLAKEIRASYEVVDLSEALSALSNAVDLIVVSGASAIADKADIVPLALTQAGGRVLRVGMPVDPGNLLVIGEIGAKPVVGAPGCARSVKQNGFDLVLERLMAGIKVTGREIEKMGVGGLLRDVPVPPRRSGDEIQSQQSIAIAVLAAGRSSRMGEHNKLLARFDDIALVRHSVQQAVNAGGQPVIVVTGHMSDKVAAEISDLPVQKVFNPAFATGLSSSLKCAVGAVPSLCSGLLIHLADMPAISTKHLAKLSNAFRDAGESKIVRATANGKRGNPVIIPRVLFDAVFALEGDMGARAFFEMSSFPVHDVELGAAAAIDVDTLDALEAAGGTFNSPR